MVQGLALALLETMAFNEMVQGSLSVSPIATCVADKHEYKADGDSSIFLYDISKLTEFSNLH